MLVGRQVAAPSERRLIRRARPMSRPRADVTFVAVAAIAAVAGVLAQFAPAAPTGDPTIDAVLVGFGVALIVLIGAAAPWWAVAAAAGAALAIAIDPVLIVLALAALGLVLWAATTGRARPEVFALSLGVAFNVLVRAELGEPFGLTAVVTGAVAALLFVTGLHPRSKLVRRRDLDRRRVPRRLRRRRHRRLRRRCRPRPSRPRGRPDQRRARRRGARERRLRGGGALVPRVGGAARASPRPVDRAGGGCGAARPDRRPAPRRGRGAERVRRARRGDGRRCARRHRRRVAAHRGRAHRPRGRRRPRRTR